MRRRLSALGAALMSPLLCLAQGGGIGLLADSVYALQGVACVGEKMRYLTPSQTLRGEALRALSTSSVADALKYFSGVQIKDYGGLGGLKTVNVRSLGSQHVGVYLDGVRISNVQNGQVDLGKFSLSNMESVSLHNANKSERLQSASEYASGATVYLQTRAPAETMLAAEYGNGSFGFHKGKVYASLRGRLFVDGEVWHSDGDYEFRFRSAWEDTTGVRRNSDISFVRLEGGAMWGGFRARAYYCASRRGLPGPVVRRLSDQWASTDRQWDRNFFAQASWRGAAGPVELKANAKYALDRLRYRQDPSANAAVMFCDNTYRQQDFFGSVAAACAVGDWLSVNAATDLRVSRLDADVARFVRVRRLDSKSVVAAIGAWRGLEWSVAALFTRVRDRRRGAAEPLSRFTPMFMASYRRGAWVWRAFHKRIFRVPTLNDLYYTLVGNVSLSPEYATQWDVGADYRDGRFRLAVDVYHNDIDDKIVAIPMQSQFRWSMVNFGRVKSDGVSLSAGYDDSFGRLALSSSVNYTCQRDRDVSVRSDPEYGNFVPYSPLHSGSAIVDLGFRRWSLCGSLLFTGERFALVSNNADDLLPPWATLDIKLTRAFDLRRARMVASAECDNATDSRHEVVKRYPMPGRNWKFSLKIEIR